MKAKERGKSRGENSDESTCRGEGTSRSERRGEICESGGKSRGDSSRGNRSNIRGKGRSETRGKIKGEIETWRAAMTGGWAAGTGRRADQIDRKKKIKT